MDAGKMRIKIEQCFDDARRLDAIAAPHQQIGGHMIALQSEEFIADDRHLTTTSPTTPGIHLLPTAPARAQTTLQNSLVGRYRRCRDVDAPGSIAHTQTSQARGHRRAPSARQCPAGAWSR